MAFSPPQGFSMITINGEEYMPTPHEVSPHFGEEMVWTSCPPDPLFLSDMGWWDSVGQDLSTQRRIWGNPSESGQVDQFRQLLHERPDRALDMMFAAAAKGKPHVVRFLLEQGVKGTAVKEDGDDMSTLPLHAASYQGRFECVKILIEEAKLDVNTVDDNGGTPLMRACWGRHPEIVEYLLKAGADINMRQSSERLADEEVAPNAFEFASGSGCLDCVKLLIGCAEELGLHASDPVTPLSVSAAAQSDDLDTLVFLLDHGGYLLAKPESSSEYDIAPLTEKMKETIEGKYKNFKQLFSIIDSRDATGQYHWTILQDSTADALIDTLFQCSVHSDSSHMLAFTSVFDIILAPPSRFTTPEFQASKPAILDDAFFWAAQHDALDTMKLITSKHANLNVNRLSIYNKPQFSHPLYTAAGLGFTNIVSYLFTSHGDQLNTHKAVGKFANGPTALWIVVCDGQHETVKLLLSLGGGPLESIDAAARPAAQENTTVVVTASRAFRCPVRLVSEAAWVQEHGELSSTDVQGISRDKDGNEIKYMVLRLEEEGAAAWWDKLQLRKSDAELFAMETSGRPLKVNPVAVETGSPILRTLTAWMPWSLW